MTAPTIPPPPRVILTNPLDELDGLQAAISAATTGVITRTPVVLNRAYDGYWPGPFPMILLSLDLFTVYRVSGGQTGMKGQDKQYGRPNLYSCEIHDVIDPRSNGTNRVAAAQTDILTLLTAITAWYDHLPNQLNPVDGVATCYRAGEDIAFKMARPFQQEDGGEIRIVAAGTISVYGLLRPGQAT
jgi:hypothetical protein